MKNKTIALSVIYSNNEDTIVKMLESVLPYVDSAYFTDTGCTDKTTELIKKYCHHYKVNCNFTLYKWDDHFARARNTHINDIQEDYVIWLDTDDELVNGDKLRELINRESLRNTTEVYLPYNYMIDKKGNVLVRHSKLRIYLNGLYRWMESEGNIHENIDCIEGKKIAVATGELYINHNKDIDTFVITSKRNLDIAQKMYKNNPEGKRSKFLYGRELFNYGEKKEEAVKILEEFLEMEGTLPAEQLQATQIVSQYYEMKGNLKKVKEMSMRSIYADENYPIGYLMLARYYLLLDEYTQAQSWLDIAKMKKMDDMTANIHQPYDIRKQIAILQADIDMNNGRAEKARTDLEVFLKNAHDNDIETIKEGLEKTHLEDYKYKMLEAVRRMLTANLRQDKLGNIESVINTLPESLQTHDDIIRFKNRIGLGKEWTRDTIVIYCGMSSEEWDGNSKAIGGSETAVIEMSKRLQKHANVYVYNTVKDKRVIDGVTYIPFEEFNPADKFHNLIIWRNSAVLKEYTFDTNKLYLWLHDVPYPFHYNQKTVDKVDKIIVLSKFHRSLLPHISDEKFYISRNGIDTEFIDSIKDVEKKDQIIYTSSPDRGLDRALDIYKEVKDQNEDVSFVFAYGWETFDRLRSNDPEQMKWKNYMVNKMKQLGVIDRGRLEKKDLYSLMKESKVWLYPTEFDEISCITAMEMQACNVYPITTGHAALKETQISGESLTTTDNKQWADRIIYNINEYQFPIDLKRVNKTYGWDNVANEWMKDLFNNIEKLKENKLSVICITTRKGMMRVLKDTLDKQTYRNFELIIIDKRYEEREGKVKEYFKDVDYDVLHLPDPKKNRKYKYGLCHAHNASLYASRGDFLVFLQDFIEIEEDSLDKINKFYNLHPQALYTGVDVRVIPNNKDVDNQDDLDVFKGEKILYGIEDFKSPRNILKGALRRSGNPFEWELNFACGPRKELLEIGGWNNDWDKGFGYDNTELALRYLYAGGEFYVDETNKATAISHWAIFGDHDKGGVENRTEKTNDKRYASYSYMLAHSNEVNVILDFQTPDYPDNILKKINAKERTTNDRN